MPNRQRNLIMQNKAIAANLPNGKSLTPLRFEPVLKRLIWGGRRLKTILGKELETEDKDYAESWELCDHAHGMSRTAEGPWIGSSLSDLVLSAGARLLGESFKDRQQFPLLIKFIDAHQVLSVQVHPDDEKGARLANDNGKTEAWVVVHAEPGSLIYAGLKKGVTREIFAEALERGKVEPLLHRFEAKVGDCVMIPAGTVHAIGAGIVLAEVQQMSDATFRVDDWGRVGADGKPRKLHLAEALEATDFDAGPVDPIRPKVEKTPFATVEHLTRCRYFELERLRLTGSTTIGMFERFTIVIGLGGSSAIEFDGRNYPLEFGQTLLLPAAIGPCSIAPVGSKESIVLTCIVPEN
ncbi:MAG: class I mannose-6-phosphate isomerase [Isosphaeraceae bacterium]